MRLVIISGLSGSGKSVALHTLEDAGFYCIDNLPVNLLPKFVAELKKSPSAAHEKIAVGIDARNLPEELNRLPDIVAELTAMGVSSELVFLEANDHALLKRFSETRRRHPLTRPDTALAEAIQRERKLLQTISAQADLHIDTSCTNIYQLRDLIRDRIEHKPQALSLLFESFGYKNGIPMDADFVFDVRCLPNPNWEPTLRALTGFDPEVAQFLDQQDTVGEMLDQLKSFLETWIPSFEASDRSYMKIAIGCTGGQHRSVYLVNRLAEHFSKMFSSVLARHRELA